MLLTNIELKFSIELNESSNTLVSDVTAFSKGLYYYGNNYLKFGDSISFSVVFELLLSFELNLPTVFALSIPAGEFLRAPHFRYAPTVSLLSLAI